MVIHVHTRVNSEITEIKSIDVWIHEVFFEICSKFFVKIKKMVHDRQ